MYSFTRFSLLLSLLPLSLIALNSLYLPILLHPLKLASSYLTTSLCTLCIPPLIFLHSFIQDTAFCMLDSVLALFHFSCSFIHLDCHFGPLSLFLCTPPFCPFRALFPPYLSAPFPHSSNFLMLSTASLLSFLPPFLYYY